MEAKINFDRPPVVVTGAMDCECSIIAGELEQCEVQTYGDCVFTEGFIDGYPVVVVKSLMGMVNAAVAATLAIDTYSPICVVCQGTSGAHDPQLHQGDIILGRDIIENCGYYTAHRNEGEGLSRLEEWSFPGKEMIVNGKSRMVKTFHSDEKLLKAAECVEYKAGTVKRGTVSSGDIWNRELDRILFYHRTFGSDCEEMEGFAIAQICAKFKIPMLLIRIISNSEFHSEEVFTETLGGLCQTYSLDVIREIIRAASS